MRWASPHGSLLDPPLVPTPDEGRDLLRRELVDPAYHRDDLLQRLIDWLVRRVGDVLDAASTAPPLSALAAMAVGFALVVALIWLATRARTAPGRRDGAEALLPDAAVTAREWRERAERALAEERPSDALVHGFRALAARQVERGRLDATPGTTAHEVAQVLRAAYPTRADAMAEGARLFDLVLYGDRPATLEQARSVLALDDELAGTR
ncbi:DUF4129 domain-containing protein [Nocardioides currus]|uniref:Protein-glutamine gamma-glutamyltransferase-like C-terminal domain-containing protein n=1 Tax=Nocardioides currus TaxID=2133958 RepID=A0A2R7YZ53_9ACTN|nr:DUF4129 domain-containing protein [Nocardioides currus]PUA81668.1 hypothetical protein C7S10_06240 [Nocardioides currus]